MRIPFPDPSAVIGGATAAADAVESAIKLVPRAAAAMTRIEALLDQAEAALRRTDAVLGSAEDAAERTRRTMDEVDIVTRDAGRRVEATAGVLDRADAALGQWEPTLRALAPQAKRFAASVSEKEVDAAIALVDRLPVVLEHLESDVLPVLKRLDHVGPDLHELLEVVEDLRRVITGLPGVGLLRRRSDDDEKRDDTPDAGN